MYLTLGSCGPLGNKTLDFRPVALHLRPKRNEMWSRTCTRGCDVKGIDPMGPKNPIIRYLGFREDVCRLQSGRVYSWPKPLTQKRAPFRVQRAKVEVGVETPGPRCPPFMASKILWVCQVFRFRFFDVSKSGFSDVEFVILVICCSYCCVYEASRFCIRVCGLIRFMV